MEAEEITSAFNEAIEKALAGAGARMDGEAWARLSYEASTAGRQFAAYDPEMQERAIADGLPLYERLIGEAVAEAKTLRQFPTVKMYALQTALTRLGSHLPYFGP